MAKGWFQKNEKKHDRMRSTFPTLKNSSKWSSFCQFEKTLWYWDYVNSTIQRDLIPLSEHKKMTLWLEDSNLENKVRDFMHLETLKLEKDNSSLHLKIKKKKLSDARHSICETQENRFRRKFNV